MLAQWWFWGYGRFALFFLGGGFFAPEPPVGVAQMLEKSKNTPISSGDLMGGSFFCAFFMLGLLWKKIRP